MKAFKKLQLVNASLSPIYIESCRAGVFPPMNLVSLATYLNEKGADYEIEILDGEILSLETLKARINADIVGFGVNILNYSTTLELAKAANERGAKVILGGHLPTAMPEAILRNRGYVDGVIMGDGEKALYQYMVGEDYTAINNLAFRDNGNIKVNFTKNLPITEFPLLNFNLIDLQPYFKNFQRRYSSKPFKNPLAVYSSKGCLWRSKSGGCVYCGIQNKGWRPKPFEIVWKEIAHLIDSYDADFFWDVSDTITANKDWLKGFAKSKPRDIAPAFHFYGRADQIDSEVAEYLCEVNCYELFIGAESGDETCLANANKGFHPDQIIKAVEILRKYKINIVLSLLLGLPGETEESAEKTLRLAESILSITPIQEAFVNIVLPLPGSKVFDMILEHPTLGEKYKNMDLFSLEELRKDWISNFCSITYNQAQKYRDKILSLFPIGSSFGKPKGVNHETVQ